MAAGDCSGNCRQDTWSDLQLFGIVNLAVIFLFSWLKAHLVDVADTGSSAEQLNKPFWTSLYEVLRPHSDHLQPRHANCHMQCSGL